MAEKTESQERSPAVKRIWYVFGVLSALTIVEVILGIIRPAFMVEIKLVDLHLLNWTFIILTIVKAYYITWSFMHMEHESSGLRRAVIWTSVFLVFYLVAILLIEGGYIHDVYKDANIKWDF